MNIPIRWLVVQGSDLPVQDMLTTQFFLDINRGLHPEQTGLYNHLSKVLPPDVVSAKVKGLVEFYASSKANGDLELPGFVAPVYLRHDGRYELRDGHHRVGMMIASGHNSIPCEVIGVNPLWTQVTRVIPEKLYQSIDHPWFAGREVIWPTKIPMVKDFLQTLQSSGIIKPEGYALDLGCYTGGMARKLRELGYTTYAIDEDPRMLLVASYLDLIFQSKAIYQQHDLLESPVTMELWPREVTTILSVLHHFLGTKEKLAVVSRILQACNNYSRVTIFDIPSPTEQWVKLDPSIVGVEGIKDFFLSHFTHHKVQVVGELQGRVFFALVSTSKS